MTGTPQVPPVEPCRSPSTRRRPRVVRWLPRLYQARVLFLDDDPRRASLFLREHPRAVWVTNVPDCLACLAEPWDEIHLDHDLGGRIYVDSADLDCGMEVIRWLCKNQPAHLKATRFYVHTHNSTAGLLMVLLMRRGGYRAEYEPFGIDLRHLLAHNEPESLRSRWAAILESVRAHFRTIAERAREIAPASVNERPPVPRP